MKILVMTELFWPQGGGAELATRLLLERLAKKGFEIIVLTNDDAEITTKLSKAIKVYRVPFLHETNAHKITLLMTNYYFLMNVKIIRLMRSADVIYMPHYWFYAIPIIRTWYRGPIVLHLYDSVFLCPLNIAKPHYSTDIFCQQLCPSPKSMACLYRYATLGKFLNHPTTVSSILIKAISYFLISPLRNIVTLADHVIVETNTQKNRLLNQFPSLRGKATTIPNLLPEIRQTPFLNKEKITLGYLGGNRLIKGLKTVLMLNKFFEDKLTIMANIDPNTIPRKKNLVNMGRIPCDSMDFFYSQIWALLFPSIWDEPSSYTVVETMLRGRPVLARKTENMLELLQGNKNLLNLLYDPGNDSDLIGKIETLMSHSHNWIENIGCSAREHILKIMDNDRSFKKFENILEKVVKKY